MRVIHFNANYNRLLFTARATLNHKLIKVLFYPLMFVICFAVLGCSKADATRELQTSTLNMAAKSEYIVVARCTSSESKWDDQKAFIFTYTTFSIDEYIKGDGLGEKITLRIIGGQVGDQILKAPHLSEFDEGEEVVLFLDPKNQYGFYNLTSQSNGILRIQTDGTSGQKIVTTPITGIEIYKNNTNRVNSQPPRDGVLLEDFIYSIKKAIY